MRVVDATRAVNVADLRLAAKRRLPRAGRGYSSDSQFTREYGRFFGSAPTKDISRLREQGVTAADA